MARVPTDTTAGGKTERGVSTNRVPRTGRDDFTSAPGRGQDDGKTRHDKSGRPDQGRRPLPSTDGLTGHTAATNDPRTPSVKGGVDLISPVGEGY